MYIYKVSGGAIYLEDTPELNGLIFKNNTAKKSGGGIMIVKITGFINSFSISDSIFQ